MSRYCMQCKETVELIEGNCPDCGTQLNNSTYAGRYYISEPNQGPGLTVNLQPGQKLFDSRYTIKSFLGRGSVSTVYLADDNMRSMQVALKVVAVASESVANRLKQEIDLHSKVFDYKHVIRVYDIHSAPYRGIALLLISNIVKCQV